MTSISLYELSTILSDFEGKEILIKTGTMGFTFRSYATLEKVNFWSGSSNEIELTLSNESTFELSEMNIKYIKQNVDSVKIMLTNEQLISIEFLD